MAKIVALVYVTFAVLYPVTGLAVGLECNAPNLALSERFSFSDCSRRMYTKFLKTYRMGGYHQTEVEFEVSFAPVEGQPGYCEVSVRVLFPNPQNLAGVSYTLYGYEWMLETAKQSPYFSNETDFSASCTDTGRAIDRGKKLIVPRVKFMLPPAKDLPDAKFLLRVWGKMI